MFGTEMKTNKSRLMAAVMMMAVLLVATAVVVSADDANAATGTTVNTDKANAFDLTNSAIGNDVAIAPVDGGYEITGTLNYIGTATEIADLDNATDVQKKFAETWPTNSDYGYGLVYQLQVENGKYVSFKASDDSWKSRPVEDGTRDILKYVNATTGTNTYYITDEATTAAPADDAEGVEKIVVSWNVILASMLSQFPRAKQSMLPTEPTLERLLLEPLVPQWILPVRTQSLLDPLTSTEPFLVL